MDSGSWNIIRKRKWVVFISRCYSAESMCTKQLVKKSRIVTRRSRTCSFAERTEVLAPDSQDPTDTVERARLDVILTALFDSSRFWMISATLGWPLVYLDSPFWPRPWYWWRYWAEIAGAELTEDGDFRSRRLLPLTILACASKSVNDVSLAAAEADEELIRRELFEDIWRGSPSKVRFEARCGFETLDVRTLGTADSGKAFSNFTSKPLESNFAKLAKPSFKAWFENSLAECCSYTFITFQVIFDSCYNLPKYRKDRHKATSNVLINVSS